MSPPGTSRWFAAVRQAGGGVCTENLNPDVVLVKPAEDRV